MIHKESSCQGAGGVASSESACWLILDYKGTYYFREGRNWKSTKGNCEVCCGSFVDSRVFHLCGLPLLMIAAENNQGCWERELCGFPNINNRLINLEKFREAEILPKLLLW